MKRDITFWIGIVLLVFTIGLLRGLPFPKDPDAYLMDLAESSVRHQAGSGMPSRADIDELYQGLLRERWVMWIQNTILLTISVASGLLAVFRKRFALQAVLGTCALFGLIAFTAILPRIFTGEYFKLVSHVFSMFLGNELDHGLWFIWNVAIAPFAYLLLGFLTLFALVRGHYGAKLCSLSNQ